MPLSHGRRVKVCFHPSSGGWHCQGNYKNAKKIGKWYVLARNVRNGTEYKLYFRTKSRHRGKYAD